MNQLLLAPGQNDFPDSIHNYLDTSSPDVDQSPTCCAFNRQGSYLAVGCSTGRVFVWDYDTRGIARSLLGHCRPITEVSWSKDSAHLLTASSDWTLVLWDVLRATIVKEIQCHSPVLSCELNPVDSTSAIFCSFTCQLVDFPLDSTTCLVNQANPVAKAAPMPAGRKHKASMAMCTSCRYSQDGSRAYVGTSDGVVQCVPLETKKPELVLTLKGRQSVVNMERSPSGKLMALNCSDRVVRLISLADHTVQRELADRISHYAWRSVCFSGDSEYLLAATGSPECKLVIWSTFDGRLEKILEGPKDPIVDVSWHPRRAYVAVCGRRQAVYLWTKSYAEDWTAFAPNVTQLEENVEYVEKEDEFDVHTEDESAKMAEADVAMTALIPAQYKRPVPQEALDATREQARRKAQEAAATNRRDIEDDADVDITTIDKSLVYDLGQSIPAGPLPRQFLPAAAVEASAGAGAGGGAGAGAGSGGGQSSAATALRVGVEAIKDGRKAALPRTASDTRAKAKAKRDRLQRASRLQQKEEERRKRKGKGKGKATGKGKGKGKPPAPRKRGRPSTAKPNLKSMAAMSSSGSSGAGRGAAALVNAGTRPSAAKRPRT